MEPLLTTQQVAKLLGKAPQTLINDRHEGRGLPYVKIGRLVRYRRAVVAKKVKECEVVPRLGKNEVLR
jgi:hypothetical protein